jgi:V-type H+-transporting ATPase subunit a
LIVDTYGVPTYKEANPIIISYVTFPFLFGMMFGDMGHGSILLMVAIYLVMKGDNEGAGMLRYILLLMGIFAVYCGLIYNEFFALPINLFQSCYQVDYQDPSYTT